jgi:cell wall-associated NlpC family hydrolase
MTETRGTMNAIEIIEQQLDGLLSKRAQLHEQLTQAQTALASAQQQLITDPGASNVDALASAQSRAAALSQALDTLDTQIIEERAAIEAATLAAVTNARRARIAEISNEREHCVEDYNRAVALADELLREPLRLMHDAAQHRAALAREAAPLLAAENITASGHPAVEFTFKPAETPLAPAVRLAYEILDQQSGYVAAKRIEIEREAKRVVPPARQEPAPQTVEWVTNRVQG